MDNLEWSVYISTKIVRAAKMSEREFLKRYRNQELEQMVLDKEGYVIKYPDGYTSWCPKAVFEITNREMEQEEVLVVTPNLEQMREDQSNYQLFQFAIQQNKEITDWFNKWKSENLHESEDEDLN